MNIDKAIIIKNYKFTFVGLFISYFSIISTVLLFKKIIGHPLGDGLIIFRESLIFIFVVILFWIITRKENLNLDSIGIRRSSFKQTLLWTIITFAFCIIGIFVCLAIFKSMGLKFGNTDNTGKLSIFTTSLIMLRAGIAEEIFFRGYIYERLNILLKSKLFAVSLSVIPFALFHYSQGLPGIFMSFILASILTLTYLWKRNLKANIIAHFLIDFIPNVLIPLLFR